MVYLHVSIFVSVSCISVSEKKNKRKYKKELNLIRNEADMDI